MVLAGLTVLVLHLLGWGSLFLLVAPSRLELGGEAQVFGVALGVTAFALGARHAFDADHIAAIDNTTRRLVGEGRPATTVGFWFSLGHSTVVVALAALVAAGMSTLVRGATDAESTWTAFTSVWGPLVAGVFLLVIAAVNVASLREADGRPGGPVTRILDRVGAHVRTPRQMYVVGLLFGLGFDTATEISLLILAGSAGVAQLPWWAVMTLPVLFAAGMATLDLVEGWVARYAYGWAVEAPGRMRRYNVTVTVLSVLVAGVVGLASLSGALSQWWGWPDPMAWTAAVATDLWGWLLAAVLLAAAAWLALARRRRTR
ncbi:high-affinity nickel-transport protein [Ornithinimicrobium avium]|uniref:Nickel/cobalt efflux system n=2 Tax=Ornithinimicrobium avium TaxID=2283195 RepID=A0A345NSM8_9MICO|nr:high-affinity nickel-transport protein [Ornithinimicrobium avium]